MSIAHKSNLFNNVVDNQIKVNIIYIFTRFTSQSLFRVPLRAKALYQELSTAPDIPSYYHFIKETEEKMKVLIVEDSIFVQKLLTKLIVDHIPGCEIQIANNGEQGYNLFTEFQPDLITTDLLMPGLNGQEMLRMIRETDSHVKIIILSADIQKTTRDEVELLGISGFLNKPLTAEKATTMIQLIQAAYHAE